MGRLAWAASNAEVLPRSCGWIEGVVLADRLPCNPRSTAYGGAFLAEVQRRARAVH